MNYAASGGKLNPHRQCCASIRPFFAYSFTTSSKVSDIRWQCEHPILLNYNITGCPLLLTSAARPILLNVWKFLRDNSTFLSAAFSLSVFSPVSIPRPTGILCCLCGISICVLRLFFQAQQKNQCFSRNISGQLHKKHLYHQFLPAEFENNNVIFEITINIVHGKFEV